MKKINKLDRAIVFFGVMVVGVVLDMLTKNLATNLLTENINGVTVSKSHALIDGVFHFTYHENPGAGWGILKDAPWVFMSISTITIIALTVYVFLSKELSTLTLVSMSFIACGGVGNMIDRVAKGYVVDFLDFCLIDFPIFNVADIFVTCGAALFIIDLIFFDFLKVKQGTSA